MQSMRIYEIFNRPLFLYYNKPQLFIRQSCHIHHGQTRSTAFLEQPGPHVELCLLIFLRVSSKRLTADPPGKSFNLHQRFYANPREVAPKETAATSSTCVRHHGTNMGQMILHAIHVRPTHHRKVGRRPITSGSLHTGCWKFQGHATNTVQLRQTGSSK